MDIIKQLQDPSIYKINRLDAHSDHKFYADEQGMNDDISTFHHSLNGSWLAHYSPRLEDRPIEFYKSNFKLAEFCDIHVPGHAELQGLGNIQYVNTQYPWDGKADILPPLIDLQDSPVISYVKYFDLPEPFKGKKVCINFCGVEQAFSLFLNGEFIGYSQDSFTPSHFELTPYIKETDNRLCVEVYKRSCFGWIEDQDFFRFSGVFRDVILYAKPAVHVEDLFAVTTVDSSLQNGELKVKLKISGTQNPNIKILLTGPTGQLIYSGKPDFVYTENTTAEPAENSDSYFVSPTIAVDDVILWDKFCPNLYLLTLTVYDNSGNVSELVRQDIGFRRFEKKGNILLLNGKKLMINGVNRHEWNPETGRAITACDMHADIEIFKRNNIDSVRTSHYPNNSLWYELCDRNGITVMDEVNMESHGTWQKNNAIHITTNVPGSLQQWRDVTIDRAVSMFERDKNHPSILFWSCANESYVGDNLLAMADYFRRKDPSRIVHYEGCFHNRDFEAISDVESHMYSPPEQCEEYMKTDGKKPFLLCEYMHNMGNSLGGFQSYMSLYDRYEGYHGGYIWDYIDQALLHNVDGKYVLGYGGDFGDRPTDYNFSGNGIVSAERKEKPAMQEVRYFYSTAKQRIIHDNFNNTYRHYSKKSDMSNSPLQLIEGNLHYGVKGEGFSMLFSTVKGGPVSINYAGTEWLCRAALPTYWRAPTENDTACGFTQRSGSWAVADRYSVATKMTAELVDYKAVIRYSYDTLQGNETDVCYIIDASGHITVELKFNGKEGLPQLPLFGLQLVTIDPITAYSYVGYSGETYPDRYNGGVYGGYTIPLDNMQPDYLVPQEYGCHSYSRCFTLRNKDGKQLKFEAEDMFHFSVLPYSTGQLEEAWHKHELPTPAHSYVRVLAKMRGVGGINTWGADVEPAYHIAADQDITLRFYIQG